MSIIFFNFIKKIPVILKRGVCLVAVDHYHARFKAFIAYDINCFGAIASGQQMYVSFFDALKG